MPFTMPRWGWYGLAAIMAALALWIAVWAIHRDGYKDGRAAEKAAWEKAEAELLKRAGEAEKEADAKAAAREADHIAAVAEERKKIDQAVAEGTSPFDAIFN